MSPVHCLKKQILQFSANFEKSRALQFVHERFCRLVYLYIYRERITLVCQIGKHIFIKNPRTLQIVTSYKIVHVRNRQHSTLTLQWTTYSTLFKSIGVQKIGLLNVACFFKCYRLATNQQAFLLSFSPPHMQNDEKDPLWPTEVALLEASKKICTRVAHLTSFGTKSEFMCLGGLDMTPLMHCTQQKTHGQKG